MCRVSSLRQPYMFTERAGRRFMRTIHRAHHVHTKPVKQPQICLHNPTRIVSTFGGRDPAVCEYLRSGRHEFYPTYSQNTPLCVTKEARTYVGRRAKREYLYIDDAVEAYLMLGAISDAKLERNRIFNFGAGKPVAVRDLIKTIGKLIREEIEIVKEKRIGKEK